MLEQGHIIDPDSQQVGADRMIPSSPEGVVPRSSSLAGGGDDPPHVGGL